MNIRPTFLTILLTCLITPAAAVADSHSPLLTGTLASATSTQCMNPFAARKHASNLAAADVKQYCRTKGYGWRSSVINDNGSLACQACGNDQVSCAYRQVAFECQPHQSDLIGRLISLVP